MNDLMLFIGSLLTAVGGTGYFTFLFAKSKYKVEVLAVPCDVTKLEDLQNLVNKTKEKFGKIDILINNAGVSSQYPFHEQPIEDFERLAHTNYLGYVRLIRLV